MALKIRLSRGGSKKRPFYRIVVAEAASPRDGRYVERLGHYNPMTAKDNDQRLVVNGERVSYWLGLGAQPTERVQKLLASLELMAPVKLREQPKKSAVGKKRETVLYSHGNRNDYAISQHRCASWSKIS